MSPSLLPLSFLHYPILLMLLFLLLDCQEEKKERRGRNILAAFTALCAELRRQSAAKREGRSTLLAARRDPTLPRGTESEVLNASLRLLDSWCAGHFGGSGHTAWPTEREEGRLALDLQPGLGCFETLGVWLCELGALAEPGSTTLDPPRSKR